MSGNQEDQEPPINIRQPNDIINNQRSLALEVLQNISQDQNENEAAHVSTPVLITPTNARSTREFVHAIPRIRRRRRIENIESTRSRRTITRRTVVSRNEKRYDNTSTAIELDPNDQIFENRLDVLLQTPNNKEEKVRIPSSLRIKDQIREINRLEIMEKARKSTGNWKECLKELENHMKMMEEEIGIIDEFVKEMKTRIEEEQIIVLKIELINEILKI
ncbi:unnamed protein product [Caenorhabditis angaria]|uniref:Uncharacterized protein n=1 Tax=Caenorhabditis angaria TaxID=860376 RepID=A0A9P1MW41_9PELO|nr:unnamed protein product [Caenorhabditis angaria]